MANFVDKAKVPMAINDHCRIDLGHQSIGTIDAFEVLPSYVKEMVPGEKLDVNMEAFLRANPMPVPSFSRYHVNHRAYFVPMRTIERNFTDFITDTVHVGSDGKLGNLISKVMTVTNWDLLHTFLEYEQLDGDMLGDGLVINVTGDPTDPNYDPTSIVYDFAVDDGSNGIDLYLLTVRGRRCMKFLEMLGYKIVMHEDCETPYSALPLLAAARIYVDWYINQQYTESVDYQALLALVNVDLYATNTIGYADVYRILVVCSQANYDSDVFVSAYDVPNQSYPGTHSDFKLLNIDTVGHILGNGSNLNYQYDYNEPGYVTNNSDNANRDNRLGQANAPFITPVVTGKRSNTDSIQPTPISESLLHTLHSLTDYMKRHQIAGATAFGRFLAQYGQALPAEKLNRSVYLGCETQNLKIGDVFSSAQTDDGNLGEYAGKGLSYGNGHYTYETNEFGYFVIMTSLIPNVGYFQGINPSLFHITKLDFFNGEFDKNMISAIPASCVYVPQVSVAGADFSDVNEHVFGFLPKYWEYKANAQDGLYGNFRLLSINGLGSATTDVQFNAADAWHSYRVFMPAEYTDPDDIVHGPSFVKAEDALQYKRMFYDSEPDAPDNFTFVENFEIISSFPGCSLWDNYDFSMSKGKDVTMEVNGVKHN